MRIPSRLFSPRSLLVILPLLAGVAAFGVVEYTRIGKQADGSYLIPTGQLLARMGSHIPVNDRPLGMALSPDAHTLAVVTGSNFNPRPLHLIDVKSQALTQTVTINDSFLERPFNQPVPTLTVCRIHP